MKRRRGIYWLPNLITTGSMFCGFYAVLAAMDARFAFAAALVFVAMLLDGMDGRVARWTGTSSEFGVQYDSLSDLVSFGVAPSLLLYQWSLHLVSRTDYLPEKLGWMVAFLYVACAALRLARFNVQVAQVDKAFFVGLPSPAAAGTVAGYVWVSQVFGWRPEYVLVSLFIMGAAALLMVSNIKFYSFKTFKLDDRIPFGKSAIPAVLLGVLFLEPAPTLFAVFSLYALHGPLWALYRQMKKRKHG
ncbi:MAG: CDP-diacylglycerol--serine O-phosphatidyltransferase [Cardiobacteriaceae bacterium]|nr:CDP-diacylglycerol--serine O-phosphatidyltransferase [Cardiobacteriaceae bacterium]